MPDYEAVIGLEVHVHLNTATKLFCACPNSFGDDPNSNVCEICGGMPGVLPTLNRKAVELATRMALAVEAEINQQSRFARKNYFYPDMPRNYQISQFESPLCRNGRLEIQVGGQTKQIRINRIHIEDDAGKLVHPVGETRSYVDLNRSGAPLIEIVSEPDLSSSAEAVAYLKALHAIVVSLGVSNGNMEEGSFRCDANVSLRPKGSPTLGTRAEIKNLNSFRNVQRGIEYEIARQTDILDDGGKVIQETRLYDAERDLTQGMRGKEDAQDYRYFPDPDLLDVLITDADLVAWRNSQPELPAARVARYCNDLSLPAQDAEQLASDPGLARLFDAAILIYNQAKKIANLLLGPVLRQINQNGLDSANLALKPEQVAELAKIVDNGLISAKIAADLLPDLLNGQTMPEQLVQERGLAQVSDSSAIEQAVLKVIEANPDEVAAYKGGKTKLLSFFVGQIMREMRGKANPAMVNELLDKYLK